MNMTTQFMDDTWHFIYNEIFNNYMPNIFKQYEYTPWIFSLLGSALIGLSGILPLFLIPHVSDNTTNNTNKNGVKGDKTSANDGDTVQINNDPSESKTLKVLLSFAVGGLLGDVFLHLLPEAWSTENNTNASGEHQHPSMKSGLWVLSGVLIFTIVEKIFSGYMNADENNPQPKCVEIANCLLRKTGGKIPVDGQTTCLANGSCDIEDVANSCFLADKHNKQNSNHHHQQPTKKVAGYLNLLANSIDNFTHGLAVAGSFLVSFRHGILATFAILLHEIPHEVGDFAILLRSGFSRWDAAKAQLLTACAGILGACVAIGGSGVTSAMEARTSWIMPFTAGGFLHIALVTVLPDLLQETDPKESLKQFASLIVGIGLMAILTVYIEH